MIERRGRARFLLEALQPIRIAGDSGREHLDDDVATEPAVPPPVNDAHSAFADFLDDLVGAEIPPYHIVASSAPAGTPAPVSATISYGPNRVPEAKVMAERAGIMSRAEPLSQIAACVASRSARLTPWSLAI
jgi:hypothetical protein